MFVPFGACTVARALSALFNKRALDDEEGGAGWLGEGEGWGWRCGWGMGDGRCGVVVLDVVARCVQHTEKKMNTNQNRRLYHSVHVCW